MTGARNRPSSSGGIPLQKRWGQHHLRSGELCRPVLEYLRPADRLVVEVGPGGGVLTRELVAAGARVVAVEVDLAWAFALGADRRSRPTRIVAADALEIDWQRFPAGTLLTGNLPFNVATPLIERVLPRWRQFDKAAFMVQKEVGERLLADPGTRAYGALTVLARARSDSVRLGVVHRGSFRPPPKVDAVFIGLELHRPPLSEPEMTRFTETVRLAFSQRRKQLRNVLERSWGRERTLRVLDEVGIEPVARAETLSLTDFLRLHRAWLDVASSGR